MITTTETWQHREIVTNGIRMHYVTQGEGPLIVLLHGFPEFWFCWHNQIGFLADLGYTVVAPDLRGYNDTDKPRSGYDMPTLLKDVEGLIQGLGREKAIIVGHDWGGAIAWVFAMRYPQMTERLIILNAPHPWALQRELRMLKQLRKSWYVFAFQIPWLPEALLSNNHAAMVARLIYKSAVQKSAFPPYILQRYQVAMSKTGAMTAALNYYRTTARIGGYGSGGTGAQSKATINAPTLLIWGEQDVALGIGLTQGLEQWVPNIKIRRIPDSGHWVQEEKPDEVNAFIADFLRG